MAGTKYNKLVRDRIPEIIRKEGGNPLTSLLSEADRLYHLYLKLLEETHEIFRSGESKEEFVKEAADLLEVVHALASIHGVKWEKIEAARATQRRRLGGFSKGILLNYIQKNKRQSQQRGYATVTPCLLTRRSSPSLLDVIHRELDNSRRCCIASAFCTRGMLNQLIRPFERFLNEGGRLQILTSVMNNFNNPDDLLHLQHELPQCEVRIFYPGNGDGQQRFAQPPTPFHLKSFLFDKLDGKPSLIVGSSNLTSGGLVGNEEWNLYSNSEINLPFALNEARSIYETARDEFDLYWTRDSVEITPTFLETYRPHWQEAREARQQTQVRMKKKSEAVPQPRPAQVEAIASLALQRRLGLSRAAVIAATGLGKTHLAAFDFQQSGMRNMLFIVHRESILREAREVFRRVLKQPRFGIVLSGQSNANEREKALQPQTSVFAMIQTLSRPDVLNRFHADQFDFLVIDEFHHSEASSYKKVLKHFKTRFLLGLTATPERMDGRDVLRFCDYNVAYESRLFDAINQGWLAPFQYFAIHDPTDYSQIRWTGIGYDEEELERGLSTDTRAELITRNLQRFLPSIGKVKALAFCTNTGHARYMTKAFNRHGFPAVCLLGDTPEDARHDAVQRLQDESNPLRIICSVDIFGEGVDIPAVSHVLMLRPTMSFTVFLQQLGRGLRKVPGKDYLVALDFVGNYRKSYIAPLILRGYSSAEEYRAATKKRQDFHLPACCTVDADTEAQRIWEEEIRRATAPRNRKELLREIYKQMRETLGYPPRLLDFLRNPDTCDPHAFVKAFGNWIRTKETMGDLTSHEKKLLNTLGEAFLQHVEKELNAVRSYKMVVLLTLLGDDPENTQWSVNWIARGFRDHYLNHLEQIVDCSVLAEATDPKQVPLGKVESLLKSMPLKYLSNKKDDFFTFDKKAGVFAAKPEMIPYWQDKDFRQLVQERVTYSLIRYFQRKNVDLNTYAFDVDSFLQMRSGFDSVHEEQEDGLAESISLPYFAGLRVAAGMFREGISEFEQDSVEVPNPGGRLSPDHHFVVRIQGGSMDAGNTPVREGDLVLMERIDSTHAGSLTAERAVAVEYREDSGDMAYSLKQIRKDSSGGYWLHSWNPSYEDIPVDTETFFPWARFLRRLEE